MPVVKTRPGGRVTGPDWIDGCERMDYKTRFRPVERLGAGGWRRLP